MLHIWLRQRWGWPTLHAPTLLRAARGEVTAESLSLLRKFLFGEIKQLSYGLTKLNKAADIAEIIEAEITGGNLAIIASGAGTDWQIDAAGKILFFEEVDERGYKIDRMLTQLQQAGVINHRQSPEAIIFGDFNGGDEADGGSLVLPVIKRFAESVAIPCFSLSGIGHGEVNNPLPFGITAIIKAEKLMLSH
jgi:muramoyltetrapeptide carboxypeptidase